MPPQKIIFGEEQINFSKNLKTTLPNGLNPDFVSHSSGPLDTQILMFYCPKLKKLMTKREIEISARLEKSENFKNLIKNVKSIFKIPDDSPNFKGISPLQQCSRLADLAISDNQNTFESTIIPKESDNYKLLESCYALWNIGSYNDNKILNSGTNYISRGIVKMIEDRKSGKNT